MSSGKMSISRLTKKARHHASTHTSTELQDIGGLLRKSPSLLQNPTPSIQSINSQTTCPLLTLPIEIRREIYRYTLPHSLPERGFRFMHDGGPDPLFEPRKATRKHHSIRRPPLVILLLSRQIYVEALSILYSENKFHFITFTYTPVLEFIRRLSPDARNKMRRIRLSLIPDQAEGAEREGGHDLFCTVVHDACPGLDELQVDPYWWM